MEHAILVAKYIGIVPQTDDIINLFSVYGIVNHITIFAGEPKTVYVYMASVHNQNGNFYDEIMFNLVVQINNDIANLQYMHPIEISYINNI